MLYDNLKRIVGILSIAFVRDMVVVSATPEGSPILASFPTTLMYEF